MAPKRRPRDLYAQLPEIVSTADGLTENAEASVAAFKEGNLPSEAAGLTGAAEAAALEGSVDNVIDGPYSPAPYGL